MNAFNIIWAYVMVFILAAVPFFEVVGVIPIAVLGGLPILPVTILALLGNLLTVVLVIIFVDYIKEWRRKRRLKKQHKLDQRRNEVEVIEEGEAEGRDGEEETVVEGKRSIRAQKIWNKFGLPGLAIIGPFFVGSHITAFMSVTFGATRRLAIVWMTASLLFWGTVVAILAYLGFDFIYAQHNEEGFIMRFFTQD